MKSIEQCLDIILHNLVKNWDKPNNERLYLNAEDLLKQFELPSSMQKHEFFKRLINKLIKDDYAEFLQNDSTHYKNSLEHYQENIVITIEGYYFITNKRGGYENAAIYAALTRSRKDSYEAQLLYGTWGVAIGAIALVVWEMIKTFCIEKH